MTFTCLTLENEDTPEMLANYDRYLNNGDLDAGWIFARYLVESGNQKDIAAGSDILGDLLLAGYVPMVAHNAASNLTGIEDVYAVIAGYNTLCWLADDGSVIAQQYCTLVKLLGYRGLCKQEVEAAWREIRSWDANEMGNLPISIIDYISGHRSDIVRADLVDWLWWHKMISHIDPYFDRNLFFDRLVAEIHAANAKCYQFGRSIAEIHEVNAKCQRQEDTKK